MSALHDRRRAGTWRFSSVSLFSGQLAPALARRRLKHPLVEVDHSLSYHFFVSGLFAGAMEYKSFLKN